MLFNNTCCFLCLILYFRKVMSFPLPRKSTFERKDISYFTLLQEADVSLMSIDQKNHAATNNITKIRAKRQGGGAGKFTDAAKMPQVKIMRLFTQLFKNFWDAAYVGGSHPLHHNIPKVVVTLYRQKIVEFFVPDVGEDPEKAMS